MNTLYYTIEALIAPHMRDEDETEWLLNGMEWNPEKCDEITRAFGILTKLTKNARNGIFSRRWRDCYIHFHPKTIPDQFLHVYL